MVFRKDLGDGAVDLAAVGVARAERRLEHRDVFRHLL